MLTAAIACVCFVAGVMLAKPVKHVATHVHDWLEHTVAPKCELAFLICMMPVLIPLTMILDWYDPDPE